MTLEGELGVQLPRERRRRLGLSIGGGDAPATEITEEAFDPALNPIRAKPAIFEADSPLFL